MLWCPSGWIQLLKLTPTFAQLKLWEKILVQCDSDSFSDGTFIDTVIPFKLDTLQESNFPGPPISICHIQRDVPVQWYTWHFEVKGYPFLLSPWTIAHWGEGPHAATRSYLTWRRAFAFGRGSHVAQSRWLENILWKRHSIAMLGIQNLWE